MATVLAADTATDQCSVAVCDAAGVRASISFRGQRAHAERLLGVVDQALDLAGIPLDGIDLFAVSQGPGSFTGLRIGAAAWKGLAFAGNKPLLGVPTLDALARGACAGDLPLCALIDAKMDEVYGAVFRAGADGAPQRLGPDRVAPVAHFLADLAGPTLFVGDGAVRYAEEIRAACPGARFAPAELAPPGAVAVGMIALARWAEGVDGDPGALAPVYLRRSQAEENAARRADAAAP